ncbi:hypothetical protein GBA52_008631 [Prunus armeniaca]|nr:hypothetical protein GBA52_008631 [Prunus armeniaca]
MEEFLELKMQQNQLICKCCHPLFQEDSLPCLLRLKLLFYQGFGNSKLALHARAELGMIILPSAHGLELGSSRPDRPNYDLTRWLGMFDPDIF